MKLHITGKALRTCSATAVGVWMAFATAASAAPLNLADNALEVVEGVEPNILILSDDSGSMDWEVMTTDAGNDGRLTGMQRDGSNTGTGSIKHRDSDDDGVADCGFASGSFYGYMYGVEFGSNTYTDGSLDCNTADDEEWRFRNSDFNPLYFDPTRTYVPWAGVDKAGNAYGNASITNAPDDPYDPSEHIDLTKNNSNWAGGTSRATSDRDGDGVADGFRYYTWTDKNGDGLFDDGEETAYLIKDQDAATQQNFANWFTYYRKREFAGKAALSHVIENNTTARIGYATINNNASSQIQVASMNASPASGNKATLLDVIYKTNSSNGTPLRRNLEKAGKYFECRSGDIFGSASDTSPGDAACPVQAAPAGSCQQNYVILLTDGFYNGSAPSVANADADDAGNDYDGGAFADTYNNTLADVAMSYYKRDLHPTLTDDVPTTPKDRNRYPGASTLGDTMHQHMSTYTIGFGVNGTISGMPGDPTVAASWPNPSTSDSAKVDDLRHAAYNGRGDYLSANDPAALASALEEVMEEIGSGTGAASSVAFNTQNIESGSLVFRAFFNTKTNTGDLVAQRVNADGSIDSTIQWSAADRLDDKTGNGSDSRVIVSYDRNGASSTGVAFRWTGSSTLTAAQKAALDSPQPASVAATVGEERLGWLRGHSEDEGTSFDDGEFRERPVEKGKLGDIVHAAPVFVGAPPFVGRGEAEYPLVDGELYHQFRNAQLGRTEVVYVGANDGMLHAFSASTGAELFAYVPNSVMNGLSTLTDPDYSHRFYVDSTPSVNDIYMIPAGASDKEWQTVLIGGLGAGGKGYYALNVTDPDEFATESDAADQVMWEFTSADDVDLGYTFSEPLVAMSNAEYADGENKWVAIFGNGYNSSSADGDAALFIAFIEEGQDGEWTAGDFIKITTGYGKAESSDGTTPNGIGGVRGIDIDGNGTVDRIYAGDLQGHLYAFDISSSNSSQWSNSSNQRVLFNAEYTGTSPATVQPITKAPVVISHPSEAGYIVVFGTGSWMTSDDATTTDIQSIYGIWDDGSTLVDTSYLIEQTFTNQLNTLHGYTVRTLTNNSIAWKNNGGNKKMGWHIDLDVPIAGGASVEFPGERAVRNMQLRGDYAFVNTVIPRSSTACTTGPGGYQLAFDPTNGGSGSGTIFDVDADGSFGINDNVGATAGDANVVTGIRFDDATPADSSFIGSQRVTQLSDQSIESTKTNTGETGSVGRHSWREL